MRDTSPTRTSPRVRLGRDRGRAGPWPPPREGADHPSRSPRLRCAALVLALVGAPGTVSVAAADTDASCGGAVVERRAVPGVPVLRGATRYVVDRTDDAAAAQACSDAVAGDCSLRGAILAANASPGADEIEVPAGTYGLTVAGAQEDAGLTGDLDVRQDVQIYGAGAGCTIVDAGDLDRVIDVLGIPSPISAVLVGLTLRNGSASDGGGARAANASLTLAYATVRDNRSATLGGGVLAGGAPTLALYESLVEGNSAGTSGGGVATSFVASLVVQDSTLRDNDALVRGGGAWVGPPGTATFVGSTVSGNTSVGAGGGVAGGDGTGAVHTISLVNSTVSGNDATEGGGIWADGTSLTVLQSTVAANVAAAGGGGGLLLDAPTTLTIENTVVAGNVATTAGENDCGFAPSGAVTSLGHNVVGIGDGCGFVDGANGDQVGSTAVPLNPLLGPLAANGGPTQTHDLVPGSPAIDQGANASCEPTDQRRYARPPANPAAGTTCDVGAVEAQPGAEVFGDGFEVCGTGRWPAVVE